MAAFQRLALSAAVVTYLLIVMGAIVRTTDSGLGCPDWPLCHGQFVPPLEMAAIIEYSHRMLGAIASVLIVAVAATGWITRRRQPSVVWPATAVVVLLVIQILLGAVTVMMELPPAVVAVHLGVAMIIFATLIWLTVAAGPAAKVAPEDEALPGGRGFLRWVVGLCLATYGLILTGALVRAIGASWACQGFPGCNGQLLPFGMNPQTDLHLTHRLTAYTIAILVGLTVIRAWPLRFRYRGIWAAAVAAGISTPVQAAIGATAVTWGPGPFVQALHVAGASAVWASVVLLASLALHNRRRLAGSEILVDSTAAMLEQQPARPAPTMQQVLLAYVELTKPRIIWLLLVTTLGAMFVAAAGMPAPALIFWTMLGGALGAGAANAINCYIDRDIDLLMSRTHVRPIPAGLVSPAGALRFGLVLGLLSFGIFAAFVNVLAGVLTMAALAFYVLVYTSWLKRTTPSNIVIGGAAGAVPPMVGWAAVTGELSWVPLYLFIIIFFWTPPHFWALSLLIKQQYERAKVPMLPVVKGDVETRRQIMLYSLFLVALTLIMVTFEFMGAFYMVAAMVLGGFFVYYAERLRREADAAAARRLFKYSIYYLVLLFAAMVVDRQMFL